MEHTRDGMDRTLITCSGRAAERFIEQWESPQPYIIAHTSGSTGKPKQIHLSKADMLVSARATCRFFGLNETSVLVSPLSADYIAGKMMVVRAMACRCRLVMLEASRQLAGVADIDTDIDLLPIVPSQIDALLKLPNLNRIHNIIIGGAPMSAAHEKAITEAGINAYATYGMTETCSHVALRHIGGDGVFTAMPGISFNVTQDGCLIIEAQEYTANRFTTTDIVELINDTQFKWLGRSDNVINSGGIKIIPEQVEELLRPYLAGIEYYITSQPSALWGSEAVIVIATHDCETNVEACLTTARKYLPHHLIPKAIRKVSELEYTANGKIKRCKL